MLHVVDQNMMRSDGLRELILAEPDSCFVIPDAAFEEMVRHERWEETMRRSLAAFAPILGRTFCSAPTGELIAYETQARTAVTFERLLLEEITDCARTIIEAVVTGSEQLGEVRRRIVDRRHKLAAERRDGAGLKEALQVAVQQLGALGGPELVAEMRSGRMDARAQLGLLKLRSDALVREFVGFDLPDAGPSRISGLMTTRYVYAYLWYRHRWLRDGGIDDAAPAKVTNDDYDQEYALISTYFTSLLSRDRKVTECAGDLRLLTREETEEEVMQALHDHAIATGRLTRAEVPLG